jgi:hypothetical protein
VKKLGNNFVDSKGGLYVPYNLVPICSGCNSECRARNLLDFIGTNPSRKFNLKKILLKLYTTYCEPDQIRKMNGSAEGMIQWMREIYKPENSVDYEKLLTLDSQDWALIREKHDIKQC